VLKPAGGSTKTFVSLYGLPREKMEIVIDLPQGDQRTRAQNSIPLPEWLSGRELAVFWP
jgi:hypothetical protein